jgi:ABC-type multidrug transport system fused ATPase/permease subunit
MTLGTLGGFATGCSLPIFNVLFGKMLDNLNDSGNNFSAAINDLCLIFVYISIGSLISGFVQVYFWSITGERQTQKFRMRYVRSILSQEIGWFDTCGASELSSNVAELTGKVQDGIGRKVGDMSQYAAQIIASFGVSFYLTWQLTLVLMCAIPLIAGAGTFMIMAITDATTKSHEQYAKAGGLATETLGAVRTVTALNMQPTVITRYRMYLFEALRVGTIKGFKVGFGNGAVFCACFLTYALGFWYGASLVADANDHCTGNNCLTGGDVIAAFFSTIMGSFALGQVRILCFPVCFFLFFSFSQIAPPLTSFQEARVAVAKIFETLNRKPLIDGLSDEGEKPDIRPAGEIILKDVHFAYPSRPNIFVCKDYQLHIKPGETVALVGQSGCGKVRIFILVDF